SQEPVPPRRLQPKTPRDLETICLKCLEKDPRNRYESAAALADDLDRFLTGEPIRARPVGTVERGWRWCRRKPAQAALLAVVIVSCFGAGLGWYAWHEADIQHKQEQADDARMKKEDEARRREQNRAAAERNRDLARDELHAGRFDSARQFLRQANDQIAG